MQRVLIVFVFLFCGCESSTNFVGTQTIPLKKQATVSQVTRWTALDVTVVDNGQPVSQQTEVKLSRSISGKPVEFVWSGLTDHQGRVFLGVQMFQAPTGYYIMEVGDGNGNFDSTWSSIPLNEGQVLNVMGDIGEGLSVVPKMDVNQIQATVFKWMIENEDSHVFIDAAFYSLAQGTYQSGSSQVYIPVDKNVTEMLPDTGLLRIPVTQCDISPDGVFDRTSGERGVLFVIRNLGMQTSQRAVVNAWVFVASLGAKFWDFTVVLQNGEWVLTEVRVIGAA